MLQKPALLAPLALLALLAGGCASNGSEEDLGQVPMVLVELYDRGAPAGMLELEIDRDGRVHALEVDIAPSELPMGVRSSVLARMPGAQITGAEREVLPSGRAWEVKLEHQGRAWEFVVDDAGGVIETEKTLERSEVPGVVVDAAELSMPGGEFASFEIIESAMRSEYHVKKTLDGASYKLVIAPNGTLVRRVREARAEIEIPLED